jgi:hypothetical protein
MRPGSLVGAEQHDGRRSEDKGWQHTRGSALLGWVKDDAQFIAQRIAALVQVPDTSPVVPPAASAPMKIAYVIYSDFTALDLVGP